MLDRKRDIFIKLDKVTEVVENLESIKELESELKSLFAKYDKLNSEENKMFENWSSYMEDTVQKLEHITL